MMYMWLPTLAADASKICRKPAGLGWLQAAALPTAYLTAGA